MSFEVKKTMNSVLYNDSCERADADNSFVGAVTIDTKVYTIFPMIPGTASIPLWAWTSSYVWMDGWMAYNYFSSQVSSEGKHFLHG